MAPSSGGPNTARSLWDRPRTTIVSASALLLAMLTRTVCHTTTGSPGPAWIGTLIHVHAIVRKFTRARGGMARATTVT